MATNSNLAIQPVSKLATNLPVSPMIPASPGPAAEAGVVQISLGAYTGQVVTGGEFGLATTMGDGNHDYQPYGDPTFQAVANQYPTDLLRHNWELNTLMDIMFPTRASASTPNYASIDTYLNQQGNLKDFFNNQTATQVVTLGFPSWLNIADPADQALYATMVKGIAQHFVDQGEPVNNYELVNEPDGRYSVTDMANTFNVVAQALKSVDPSYKLGGLTESYARLDDLQTFFKITAPNIGFVSWHQYVTNGADGKTDQQVVTDSMTGVARDAQSVRAAMQAAGIPDEVPMFLGEYNVNGAVYTDPNNGNMVGAITAAATTYGIIHSNKNMTMGALWDVMNDSKYSVFGQQGNYQVDSVGIVLGDLTSYMPGYLVPTTMPSDTPGLVGYTTADNQVFSTALINTNLSQGYTVDLSKDGLPTTGLYRIEVSPSNPQGAKTAMTDLSHVSVAAGSLVIISDEDPHSGTELNGTTSTAPPPAPVPTPTPDPTQAVLPVQSVATPPATGTTPGSTDTGSTTPGSSTTPPADGTTPGIDAGSGATSSPSTTPPTPVPAPIPIPTPTLPPTQAVPPVQAAATPPAAGTTPGSTTTPAGAIPTPSPVVTPPTVGTGPDTMVLRLSEDAYKGDAQFVLTVDGKPVGPVQSVTALHSQGQSEAFTLKGDWGAGAHQFGVSFVNDLWDGTPATDRNLYVDRATFNGSPVQNAVALWGNDTVPFGTASAPQPSSQTASPGAAGAAASNAGAGGPATPPTVGSGPDTVAVNVSEDAYKGNAQFVFTVDGQPVGPTQTVTALHSQGQSETFTIKGDWAAGAHQFGVSFLNDLWGGTPATDPNLYINNATFDAGQVENPVTLFTNNAALFGTAPIMEPPSLPGSTSQTATAVGTPPASDTVATIDSQTLAFGSGTQGMTFASPQNLTITGGPGADTVTATAGTNTFIAGTGSMDNTGGSGASNFVLHAGGGKLTIEDFQLGKGDILTVDKALQANVKQASDGHGGTLLTFGANQGSIDLIGYSASTPPHVTFA